MVKVKLTFSWKPEGASAGLAYVVHNNVPVKVSGTSGGSPLTFEYEAEAAPVHLVAWGLEFVGKQLTDLEATGSVAGGPGRKLGTNDEAWHLWKGWKVI